MIRNWNYYFEQNNCDYQFNYYSAWLKNDKLLLTKTRIPQENSGLGNPGYDFHWSSSLIVDYVAQFLEVARDATFNIN